MIDFSRDYLLDRRQTIMKISIKRRAKFIIAYFQSSRSVWNYVLNCRVCLQRHIFFLDDLYILPQLLLFRNQCASPSTIEARVRTLCKVRSILFLHVFNLKFRKYFIRCLHLLSDNFFFIHLPCKLICRRK